MTSTPWRQLARTQSGTIRRDQLKQNGVSDRVIDRMLATGALTPVHRGVLLVGGAPLSHRARLWAAVLATGGVLCGTTAGALWGLIDGPGNQLSVLVPHGRRIKCPDGVRLRRWRDRQPPTDDIDGLPVTSRTWTTLSLLAELRSDHSIRLADRALQQGWITKAQLAQRVHDFPHRRGNPQLRILLTTIGDGAAAESERKLHRLLEGAGITGWTANEPIWVDGMLIAVVDVALSRYKIAIEIDGMAHHVDVDQFRRDRSRQNQLVTHGWTVLRFTWADLTERPRYIERTIRSAMTRYGESWPP